jgi:iron complex outermembrane receptor protein
MFNADYTYTSSLFNDTENSSYLRRDPVNMVNGSVSYRAADDRWRLTVGGTNLFNERYIVTGGVNRAAGLVFASYNAPTEWYATVGVKF